MTSAELAQIARSTGFSTIAVEMFTEQFQGFANAVLERAAVEIDNHCQDLCQGDKDMQKYRERSKSTRTFYAETVRALKINTGEEPTA